MKQTTLAAAGFEKHGRSTRKAEFLSRMDALVPWSKFFALIETHYPKAGNGHSPVGLERLNRPSASRRSISNSAATQSSTGSPPSKPRRWAM